MFEFYNVVCNTSCHVIHCTIVWLSKDARVVDKIDLSRLAGFECLYERICNSACLDPRCKQALRTMWYKCPENPIKFETNVFVPKTHQIYSVHSIVFTSFLPSRLNHAYMTFVFSEGSVLAVIGKPRNRHFQIYLLTFPGPNQTLVFYSG